MSKTFKQFLKEAKIKDRINIVSDITMGSLLVDIIERYDRYPEIRLGNCRYTIFDNAFENPVSFEKQNNLSHEEVVKRQNEYFNLLDKEEEKIRKDVLKLMQDFDNGLKDILKKYKAK